MHMYRYLCVCLLLVFAGCSERSKDSWEIRYELAEKSGRPIVVGIAWTEGEEKAQFLRGIQLAHEEITAKGLRVGGEKRKLKLIKYYEPSPFGEGYRHRERNYAQTIARRSARALSAHKEVIAVIGHEYSTVAIPASVIYLTEGILYMAPSATMIALTQPGFENIFRTTINNEHEGEQLAAFCYYHDYRKLAVINLRSHPYSEELAETFSKHVAKIAEDKKDSNFRVVFRGSFFEHQKDLRNLIAELRGVEFDAVFIPLFSDAALRLLGQSDEMGLSTTFIGNDELASSGFEQMIPVNRLKKTGIDMIIPVAYNPSSNMAQAFVEKFETRFGVHPDDRAARGYDSLKLLAEALEKSPSAVPIVVANTLRFMEPWIGSTGVFAFDHNGELKGKVLFFKEMSDKGKFLPIAGAHLPYLFERLEKRRLAEERSEQEALRKQAKLAALAELSRETKHQHLEFGTPTEKAVKPLSSVPAESAPQSPDAEGRTEPRTRPAADITESVPIEHPMVRVLLGQEDDAPRLPNWGPYFELALRFLPGSTEQIEDPAQLMFLGEGLRHPALEDKEILIQVHTDASGNAETNLSLTRERAFLLKQRLTEQFGIAETRIVTQGLGSREPIASNETAAGRQRNRRIKVAVRDLPREENK